MGYVLLPPHNCVSRWDRMVSNLTRPDQRISPARLKLAVFRPVLHKVSLTLEMDRNLLSVTDVNTWYLIGAVAIWWFVAMLAAFVTWPAASPVAQTAERTEVRTTARKLAA
jgi:hypothetical protein